MAWVARISLSASSASVETQFEKRTLAARLFSPQGCSPPFLPSRPAPPRRRHRGCSGRGGGSSRRRARAQFAWRSSPHLLLPRPRFSVSVSLAPWEAGSFGRTEKETGSGLGAPCAIMAVSTKRCHGSWLMSWRSSWSSSRSLYGVLFQPLRYVGMASSAHDGLDIADDILCLLQRRTAEISCCGLACMVVALDVNSKNIKVT